MRDLALVLVILLFVACVFSFDFSSFFKQSTGSGQKSSSEEENESFYHSRREFMSFFYCFLTT